jgi:uncharacterized protein YkwD
MHRSLLAIIVFIALFVPAVRAQAAPIQPKPSASATRIVQLVNQRRAAAGLKPLRVNSLLMREAQRFSGVQAALGRLSHRGTDGTTAGQRLTRAGYRWAFYGENLAAGQQSAEEVVAAWMASPSHRANVLSPKAREIGVGHTLRGDDPAGYYDYYTMEIGRAR